MQIPFPPNDHHLDVAYVRAHLRNGVPLPSPARAPPAASASPRFIILRDPSQRSVFGYAASRTVVIAVPPLPIYPFPALRTLMLSRSASSVSGHTSGHAIWRTHSMETLANARRSKTPRVAFLSPVARHQLHVSRSLAWHWPPLRDALRCFLGICSAARSRSCLDGASGE